jgi:hypothetical protein
MNDINRFLAPYNFTDDTRAACIALLRLIDHDIHDQQYISYVFKNLYFLKYRTYSDGHWSEDFKRMSQWFLNLKKAIGADGGEISRLDINLLYEIVARTLRSKLNRAILLTEYQLHRLSTPWNSESLYHFLILKDDIANYNELINAINQTKRSPITAEDLLKRLEDHAEMFAYYDQQLSLKELLDFVAVDDYLLHNHIVANPTTYNPAHQEQYLDTVISLVNILQRNYDGIDSVAALVKAFAIENEDDVYIFSLFFEEFRPYITTIEALISNHLTYKEIYRIVDSMGRLFGLTKYDHELFVRGCFQYYAFEDEEFFELIGLKLEGVVAISRLLYFYFDKEINRNSIKEVYPLYQVSSGNIESFIRETIHRNLFGNNDVADLVLREVIVSQGVVDVIINYCKLSKTEVKRRLWREYLKHIFLINDLTNKTLLCLSKSFQKYRHLNSFVIFLRDKYSDVVISKYLNLIARISEQDLGSVFATTAAIECHLNSYPSRDLDNIKSLFSIKFAADRDLTRILSNSDITDKAILKYHRLCKRAQISPYNRYTIEELNQILYLLNWWKKPEQFSSVDEVLSVAKSIEYHRFSETTYSYFLKILMHLYSENNSSIFQNAYSNHGIKHFANLLLQMISRRGNVSSRQLLYFMRSLGQYKVTEIVYIKALLRIINRQHQHALEVFTLRNKLSNIIDLKWIDFSIDPYTLLKRGFPDEVTDKKEYKDIIDEYDQNLAIAESVYRRPQLRGGTRIDRKQSSIQRSGMHLR